MNYQHRIVGKAEALATLLSLSSEDQVKAGRTQREALEAGELYKIVGHGIVDLSFYASRTLKALALCLNANGFVRAGEHYEVLLITKRNAGCSWTKPYGSIDIIAEASS